MVTGCTHHDQIVRGQLVDQNRHRGVRRRDRRDLEVGMQVGDDGLHFHETVVRFREQ
jgi:hypothetical protein